MGNYSGFELNINYIKDEKYSLQISYYHHLIEAKEKPEDYRNDFWLDWGSLFLFPDIEVPDTNHSFNILGGYMYNLNPQGTIRLNLQAGIALIHTRYITNFKKKNRTYLFGDNYYYDSRYRNRIGFIVNPQIEFPFFKGYGLSVSPLVEFGGRKTVYGVGISHIFGRVRKSFDDAIGSLEKSDD